MGGAWDLEASNQERTHRCAKCGMRSIQPPSVVARDDSYTTAWEKLRDFYRCWVESIAPPCASSLKGASAVATFQVNESATCKRTRNSVGAQKAAFAGLVPSLDKSRTSRARELHLPTRQGGG
jgi:hypothetical protein